MSRNVTEFKDKDGNVYDVKDAESRAQLEVLNNALETSVPSVFESDATDVDLDVSDENGNVIARFQDGHIKVKEFDSGRDINKTKPTNASDNVDLDITDTTGNVIARFENGYIKTKKFDSTDPFEIPSYYKDYLDAKCARIKELLATSGDDAFFFITDMHMKQGNDIPNTHNAYKLIKYIADKCRINKLFCGGDILDGVDETYADELRKAVGGRAYFVVGNHDYMQNGYDTLFAYHLTASTDDEIGNSLRRYYYVDNPKHKIRYVVLNGGIRASNSSYVHNYEQAQLTWFENVALNVEVGWTIVVFSHLFYAPENMTTPSLVLDNQDKAVLDIVDAYNGNGEIALLVQGHAHFDATATTTGGNTVCVTCCDKWKPYSSETESWLDNHVPGTTSEQCFDVFIFNRNIKKLIAVRIGVYSTGNGETDATLNAAGERIFSY